MTNKANRYDAIDEYILAEIEYEYLHADRRGNLDILKKIYLNDKDTKYYIPYELAKLFIEKADAYNLLWLAKHGGNFDYREPDYINKGDDAGYETVYKYPDRNLWAIFEASENDYVKASLRENKDYESGGIFISIRLAEKLNELTQTERLALMRNQFDSPVSLLSIANELFDSDSKLGFLSSEEKNDLRRAIFTNQYLIDYTHDIANDGFSTGEIKRDLNQLWQSVYACDDYMTKELAFKLIGGLDKTKASIYSNLLADMSETDDDETSFKNMGNDRLRYSIISNCTTKDSDTLKLGIQDPTFYISNLAESKYVPKSKSGFWHYIKTYSPSVLHEIFNIIIVIVLVSQFEARMQLLLICAVIYSYVILNYKSTNTLISNARQSLMLVSNIKLIKSGTQEATSKDKDIMTAESILKVATIKLYIAGVGTSIISFYLAYKFIATIM